jgi:integrase
MYTVAQYLDELDGVLSPQTIRLYRNVLLSFSRFLNVELDQVHLHLLPGNLQKYAGSRKNRSPKGTKTNLNVLTRFYKINNVQMDVLQEAVLKKRKKKGERKPSQHEDKTLTRELLKQMIDVGNSHSRAILVTLISTGMRAGECAKLKLSDYHGDYIDIPDEIAKNETGGRVFLTDECQEFMKIWLKERSEYITAATKRNKGLVKGGYSKPRPDSDDRLFACGYSSLHHILQRLYQKVDGERGKYGDKITPHSTRRYFRSHAVSGMPLDTVEFLMRHQGYLTKEYVRLEDAREQFFNGQHCLYITRHEDRLTTNTLDELKQKNKELTDKVKKLEGAAGSLEEQEKSILIQDIMKRVQEMMNRSG